MTTYGDKKYWDDRYSKEQTPFDWYLNLEGLRPIIEKYLQPESAILDCGCGSSQLPEKLYDAGFKNITCIDYSEGIIEKMKNDNATNRSEIKWEVMDVCEMNFKGESFDVVIDKGTSDSLFCGERSFEKVGKMMEEISRVLKKNGILITLSYAVPDYRMQHFNNEKFGWTVTEQPVKKFEGAGEDQNYHVYLMEKSEEERREKSEEELEKEQTEGNEEEKGADENDEEGHKEENPAEENIDEATTEPPAEPPTEPPAEPPTEDNGEEPTTPPPQTPASEPPAESPEDPLAEADGEANDEL